MKEDKEISKRILLLLKLDARRLFARIKHRHPEYMQVFSSKRTRDHFPDIFKNKYDQVTLSDLSHCGEEVIIGLDQFYGRVEELHWYLNHTQEMPATVEAKILKDIQEIEKYHEILQLCIQADLPRT